MAQNRKPSGSPSNDLEQSTQTGDGVFLVDSHQRIVHWNDAAAALLGYPSEEVLGKHCYEVIKTRECDGAMPCCLNCPTICDARKHGDWGSHHHVSAETKSAKRIRLSIASFSLLSSERRFQSLAHIAWEVGEAARLSDSETESERPTPAPFPMPFLTSQEQNVLRCLAVGMATGAIGDLLVISPTTVRNHVENILRKLGAHSRLEAVALAYQRHWV